MGSLVLVWLLGVVFLVCCLLFGLLFDVAGHHFDRVV